MRNCIVLLLAALLAACSGRSEDPRSSPGSSQTSGSRVTSTPSSVPWAAKPFQEWPQLLLTNEAHFEGHSSLYGASAFLIRNKRGTVLAATALHLIGEAGGVEPEIASHDLDKVLQSWTLSIRNDDFSRRVNASGSAPPGVEDPYLDWLLLKLMDQSDKLPAVPLEFRSTPVSVGEAVYLLGVPYTDGQSPQNLYRGTVTARGFRDRFRYSIDPPADIRGFSGAPILDEKGFVVGIMTLWFEPKMDGEMFLEAGGEDIAPIISGIESAG